MAQLRLYTTCGEYFICNTTSLFVKRYNSMIKDIDISKTHDHIINARGRDLKLKYNSDFNMFLRLIGVI